MSTHPPLYRGMGLNTLSAMTKNDMIIFENDFGDGIIQGSSFSSDKDRATGFARRIKYDNPIVISIKENAVLNAQPIALSNLEEEDLFLNPDLTRHIYNYQDHDFEDQNRRHTNDRLISAWLSLEEDRKRDIYPSEHFEELDEFISTYEKTLNIYITIIPQDVSDWLGRPLPKESDSIEYKLKFIDDMNIAYGLGKVKTRIPLVPFAKVSDIPHQLLVRTALRLSKQEDEIVTLLPTTVTIDDVEIEKL